VLVIISELAKAAVAGGYLADPWPRASTTLQNIILAILSLSPTRHIEEVSLKEKGRIGN
jgi:hypothetical protein